MNRIVLVVSGLAVSSASAQSLNIALMGRVSGTDTWSSSVLALPGSTVQMGIFMSGEGIYAVGGATLRLTATGMTGATAAFAEGTSTGRVAPFNFGAATNAIFASANGFRIDGVTDADNVNTNAGLTFFQRDPATAAPGTFSTANPALVFRFDVTLGASPEGTTLLMTLDQLARGLGVYYEGPQSTRSSQTSAVTLSGAQIHVPAPGALAILMVGAVPRRRRSSRPA